MCGFACAATPKIALRLAKGQRNAGNAEASA